MFLHHPFTHAFGLDIGDLSIKLVRLEPAPTWRGKPELAVADVRTLRLPPGAIVNGEIQQPEIVRHKLLVLLGSEGSKKPVPAPWVVSSLPDPKTFLKLIELPIPAAELTTEEVLFQAKKHVPFDLEDSFYDWQAVPAADRSEAHTGILFAAAPKAVADTYTYLLESVGLRPLALEIEAVALTRSLLLSTTDYSSEARLIVDLGATRSSLIIYDHNTIQFSVSSPFSGELLTTALATHLKLDLEEAEHLKISQGIGYYKPKPQYLKVVTEIGRMLLHEIKKTLDFYKEHYPNANQVTRIVLSGGGGALQNLDTMISRSLKIATHPGNPWKNVTKHHVSTATPSELLGLSAATGLALRAVRNPLQE